MALPKEYFVARGTATGLLEHHVKQFTPEKIQDLIDSFNQRQPPLSIRHQPGRIIGKALNGRIQDGKFVFDYETIPYGSLDEEGQKAVDEIISREMTGVSVNVHGVGDHETTRFAWMDVAVCREDESKLVGAKMDHKISVVATDASRERYTINGKIESVTANEKEISPQFSSSKAMSQPETTPTEPMEADQGAPSSAAETQTKKPDEIIYFDGKGRPQMPPMDELEDLKKNMSPEAWSKFEGTLAQMQKAFDKRLDELNQLGSNYKSDLEVTKEDFVSKSKPLVDEINKEAKKYGYGTPQAAQFFDDMANDISAVHALSQLRGMHQRIHNLEKELDEQKKMNADLNKQVTTQKRMKTAATASGDASLSSKREGEESVSELAREANKTKTVGETEQGSSYDKFKMNKKAVVQCAVNKKGETITFEDKPIPREKASLYKRFVTERLQNAPKVVQYQE